MTESSAPTDNFINLLAGSQSPAKICRNFIGGLSNRESRASDQGRKLSAELLGVKDGKVTLKMANGKKYDIDPVTLSEADQTYITQWQKAQETASATEALRRPKAESGTSFTGRRQWTSAQGKKLSAELLGIKDGKVTLKMANGKKYDIDPDTLSEADQAYITQWQKAQGDRIRDQKKHSQTFNTQQMDSLSPVK